jgi:hypothetical protein
MTSYQCFNLRYGVAVYENQYDQNSSMFIEISEILLQRLESFLNQIVTKLFLYGFIFLEVEMYMYITLAYSLRSWYVINEYQSMDSLA